jgi:hypothetical protein
VCGALLLLAAAPAAHAQSVSVTLTVKNKKFMPSEIRAPANRPIVVHIKNNDAVAMEFESHDLRVEKVIPANGSGVVNIRAQKPGTYSFFDDFHEENRGTLIVQ